MFIKVISGILLLISVVLSLRHGWAGVSGTISPETAKFMAPLGISPPVLLGLSWVNLLVAGLLLFPATFFLGNLLNAAGIVLLMGYALHTGNPRIAALEIPFLLLPLGLLWLRHPLAK